MEIKSYCNTVTYLSNITFIYSYYLIAKTGCRECGKFALFDPLDETIDGYYSKVHASHTHAHTEAFKDVRSPLL